MLTEKAQRPYELVRSTTQQTMTCNIYYLESRAVRGYGNFGYPTRPVTRKLSNDAENNTVVATADSKNVYRRRLLRLLC